MTTHGVTVPLQLVGIETRNVTLRALREDGFSPIEGVVIAPSIRLAPMAVGEDPPWIPLEHNCTTGTKSPKL